MSSAFRTTADRASFALFAMAVLIAAAALLYMLAARQSLGVAGLLDAAAERSAFSPTVFEFYDRSTKLNCDRLIVVQPFEWYVWCCRGRLLILNPEGGIRCSAGKTPAVRVTASSEFVETCVDVNLTTLIDHYRANGVYFRIAYDLPAGTKTFTILSALNALAPEWIEIRDESSSSSSSSSGSKNNDEHASVSNATVTDADRGDALDAVTKDTTGRPIVAVIKSDNEDDNDDDDDDDDDDGDEDDVKSTTASRSRSRRDVRSSDSSPATSSTKQPSIVNVTTPTTGTTVVGGRQHGTYGRWLTANELERVVRPPLRRATNRDHNALLEAYRFHVYGPGNS